MAEPAAPTLSEATFPLGYGITRQIVSYPPSDMSPTPSPLGMNPFPDADPQSPSPPTSPSPQRTPTSNTLISPNLADPNDVTMEDPSANHQGRIPPPEPSNLRRPRPLAISRSEGNIPITRAPLLALGPSLSITARLQAAAERNAATATTTNRGPPREPIDKYTCAPMPTVHDAHPTAALEHIDINLVREWEKFPAGKLLALPFESEAQDASLYDSVKGRIFTAVKEITQAQEIGVSAPKRSPDAERMNRTPSTFLIYNLTDEQCDLLLQRKVWSSSAITFRVTQLNPPCPDFLFTIKGFSTLVIEEILEMVHTVWQSEEIHVLSDTITEVFPEDDRAAAKTSIRAFINSVRITHLDIKSSGNTLQPHFNVYASGNKIENDDVWMYLRNYLASCTYGSPLHGEGTTKLTPFHCAVCHGVDHPRGLCPFPATPGWNGPGTRTYTNNNTNRRGGRGGRMRGINARGRR
jgi:hypothetical protein